MYITLGDFSSGSNLAEFGLGSMLRSMGKKTSTKPFKTLGQELKGARMSKAYGRRARTGSKYAMSKYPLGGKFTPKKSYAGMEKSLAQGLTSVRMRSKAGV